MKKTLTKLPLVAALLMLAGAAGAAGNSDTASVGVSAAVVSDCAVGHGAPIAFGNLTMLDHTNVAPSTADDTTYTTSAFDAICTNGTSAPLFTYTSAHDASGVFRLVGADTSTYIIYSLYPASVTTGAALTGATATAHPSFTSTGLTQSLPLAAKVLAADKSGKLKQAYSDTVTVLVTWTP